MKHKVNIVIVRDALRGIVENMDPNSYIIIEFWEEDEHEPRTECGQNPND